MSIKVVAGFGEGFRHQWRLVLQQALPLMKCGYTLKEALLAYEYQCGHNLTEDRSGSVIIFDGGETLLFHGLYRTMIWGVLSEEEDGLYWFDERYAVCPDKTVLFFD